jgi:nitrate/nitrite-specific signal transduction histidine kinase
MVPMNKIKDIRHTLQHRLLLAFLSMSLLVLIAIGAGIYYGRSVDGVIAATRVGLDQIQIVNNIQREWRAVSQAVDTLFLTRQVDSAKVSLETTLQTLNTQLEELQRQPLGTRESTISSNREILRDLLLANSNIHSVVDELIRLAAEGRWAVARDLRESVFTTEQTTFNDGLQMLNTNVRNDVTVLYEDAKRLQDLTRLTTVITSACAFAIALLLTIGGTRSIVVPVKQLTQAVQRVTLGDFQPLTPLSRKDEIGHLSRSFALMTEWLRDSYETLEERVAERTSELERQNIQISVAAEIARDVSTTRNPEKLLSRAVNLVAQRFGYYHIGIYLLDEVKEYVELKAVSNSTGDENISGEYKVRVTNAGIVGQVALSGEPRASLGIDQEQPADLDNLLPETLSEIVLPMKVSNEVIGVLDVQSQSADAFRDSDQHVLQILADLLAVAIHNAQLNLKIEENLNELETLYGQYSRKSWARTHHTLKVNGYSYDQTGVHPIDHSHNQKHNGDIPPASISLKVRDHEIGTLNVWPGENRLIAEDLRILEELGSRISQTMENARLFNETQRRAENERIVRQVSAHMRETLDIESVLRAAVEEIYHALNLSQVTIDLCPEGYLEEDSLSDPMR